METSKNHKSPKRFFLSLVNVAKFYLVCVCVVVVDVVVVVVVVVVLSYLQVSKQLTGC